MMKLIPLITLGVLISIPGCLLAALFFGERKPLRNSDKSSRLARTVRASGVLLLLLVITTFALGYALNLWLLLTLLPTVIVSVGVASLSDPNDSSVGSRNRLVTKEKYLAAKARLEHKSVTADMSSSDGEAASDRLRTSREKPRGRVFDDRS